MTLFRNLSKSQRRALRDLAALAHDRELSVELAQLHDAFARWRSGELDPHELNDLIHSFHQGPSRKLYSRYTDSDPIMAVAAAVVRGVLTEAEIPEAVMPELASSIAFFRREPFGVGEQSDDA